MGSSQSTSKENSIWATYFGANGWLIEFNGVNLLIDPWLTGELVFPPGKWFLKGCLPFEREITSKIDLILLTQGLPDHTHPPTLEKLAKSIPVIGSKKATELATSN